MEKLNIIILEGNQDVCDTLSRSLSANYKLYIFNQTTDGLREIILVKPDIIIIDLNTPGIPGEELIIKLKSIGVKAPILILSKEVNVKQKLKFYNLGVEEYLIKPISIGELKAKLNIIANRLLYLKSNLNFNLSTNKLVLNQNKRSVTRENSKEIFLRQKEYAILEYLYQNVGQIVSRQTLTSYAWNNTFKPWSNSVDVHIKYLRDKIDRPFKKQLISTVHGQGYRLEND